MEMIPLLICVALCADEPVLVKVGPIPKEVRDYFQRADVSRESMTKRFETQISDLEIDIRGETNPNKKAKLRRDLKDVGESLKELKRSKVYAQMPRNPPIGAIGNFEAAYVVAVIDDKTVVVRVNASMAVITGVSTKSMKKGEKIGGPDFWRVTSKSFDDEAIRRRLTGDDSYFVEPVKKNEIEQYRDAYEAEKKLKAQNKPEEAKPKAER